MHGNLYTQSEGQTSFEFLQNDADCFQNDNLEDFVEPAKLVYRLNCPVANFDNWSWRGAQSTASLPFSLRRAAALCITFY